MNACVLWSFFTEWQRTHVQRRFVGTCTIFQTEGMEHKDESLSSEENTEAADEQNNNQFKYNLIGMILQTLSMAIQLGAFALFKYAAINKKISLFEIILVSNFIQNMIAWILWNLPSSITLKPKHNKLWYGEKKNRYYIWLRGCLYWIDLYLYYKGISLMSLGDAEAIYFLGPIFTAFGGRVLFKEKFSRYFIFTFILTIVGLSIICEPIISDTKINYGLIFLIIGCVCYASMNLIVRKVQNAFWIQLEIAASFQAFAVWTPLAILINLMFDKYGIDINLDNEDNEWMISYDIFGLLASIGILVMSGLLFSVLSYQYGEATKVSWMEYTNVPFGYLFQYLLDGIYPTVSQIIGALVVMSSCIVGAIEQYLEYTNNSNDKLLESKVKTYDSIN